MPSANLREHGSEAGDTAMGKSSVSRSTCWAKFHGIRQRGRRNVWEAGRRASVN